MLNRANKKRIMEKYRKIKRHKIKYTRRRKKHNVLKTILFIILLAALVFLAYSVAGPVKKLLTGELKGSDTSSALSVNSGTVSSQNASATSSAASQPTGMQSMKILEMPKETILNPAKQDAFLAAAKSKGYQAVSAELKDDTGIIYFQSSVAATASKKAIDAKAIAADALAKKIRDAGMIPVAAVHTFKDKIAPDKTKDNTFLVKNSTYTWFDKAASNGGKPWLNPYKETARNYNLTIVEDLAKAGFQQIILKSVHFPEINSMGKAQLDSATPAAEILSQYVAAAEKTAEKYQAKVAVSYDSVAYWQEKKVTYGGEAGGIQANNIAPVIRLSEYGDKLTFGETAIENPRENIDDAVKAVVAQIQANTAAKKPNIVPIIASGQKTDEIVKALAEAGITSYMVES